MQGLKCGFILAVVFTVFAGCSESVDVDELKRLSNNIVDENYSDSLIFPDLLMVNSPEVIDYDRDQTFENIYGYLNRNKNISSVKCKNLADAYKSSSHDKFEEYEREQLIDSLLVGCEREIAKERSQLLEEGKSGFWRFRVSMKANDYNVRSEFFNICGGYEILVEENADEKLELSKLGENDKWKLTVIPSFGKVKFFKKRALVFEFRQDGLLGMPVGEPFDEINFVDWSPEGHDCLKLKMARSEAKNKEKDIVGKKVFLEIFGRYISVVDTGRMYTDPSLGEFGVYAGDKIMGIKIEANGYRLLDDQERALTKWFFIATEPRKG